EGSLRCDANVSLRPHGSPDLGVKVEVKNMNSIRSVERALRFEVERQERALQAGEPIAQETRHWDENRNVTTPGRSKEYASDYRYFPEPDLTPIEPDPAWIEKLRTELPELPSARRLRYQDEYRLEPHQAAVIGGSRSWAEFLEKAVAMGAEPRAAANWMTGDLAALLREHDQSLEGSKVTPQHIADLVRLFAGETISSAGAKAALAEAFVTGVPIEEIVESKGLRQVSDAGAL